MSSKEIEALRKKGVTTATAQKWGADQFAQPAAGEAFAIFPERPPMTGSSAYNYHFATVVMATGNDRVTFENAGAKQNEKTANWSFRTYGTKEGQSFHEQWSRKFHGVTTTLVMRNLPQTPANIGESVAKPTADLIALYDSSPANAQFYLKRELDKRNVTGTIQVVKKDDFVGDDEPFLKFPVGSSSVETAHPHIKEGAAGTVSIPASQLLPVANPLNVKVMEWDLLSFNDLIGTVAWPAPYTSVTTTVSDGSATYMVSLSL